LKIIYNATGPNLSSVAAAANIIDKMPPMTPGIA